MFKNPIDVCLGPVGYIFLLTYDDSTNESKVYRTQLHNPVDKIDLVHTVVAQQMWYVDKRLFFFQPDQQISFISFGSKELEKMRSKDEVVAFANSFGLHIEKKNHTLDQLRQRVKRKQDQLAKEYKTHKFSKTNVNIEDNPCYGALSLEEDSRKKGQATFYAYDHLKKEIQRLTPNSTGKFFYPFIIYQF